MPRRPDPIATEPRGVLRTHTAEALGVSPERLRRRDIEHPHHGLVRIGLDPDDTSDDDLEMRARSLATLLGDGRWFSHSTALGLYGAPLPARERRRLHVSVAFPRTPPRRPGVTGHAVRCADTRVRHGLLVAHPAAAWCESAAVLSAENLVAAGDFLITGNRHATPPTAPATTLAELDAMVTSRPRVAGAPKLRWALPRLRPGVDSPAESRLRLALVAGGLPEPAVDAPVEVGAGVPWHADLAYPGAHVVLEYEGDAHRTDRGRWMRDIARRERMEARGFRVIRITADDLRDAPARARLCARVAAALAARRSA